MPHVFLIGYRGAGKTTVARLLAERLECGWCDADQVLQQRSGRTIRDIFEESGEAVFRDLESEVVAELSAAEVPQVVALGGGAVLREENRRNLAGGLVVWLRIGEAAVLQRLAGDPSSQQQRPQLTDADQVEEVRQLLRIRTPIYSGCADHAVDTEGKTPDQVASEIARWVVAQPSWTSLSE